MCDVGNWCNDILQGTAENKGFIDGKFGHVKW